MYFLGERAQTHAEMLLCFEHAWVLLNSSAIPSSLRCIWKLWLPITKSLVVLSAWQVNVNLNQWLLPLYPLTHLFLTFPSFLLRKHNHTYVSAALLHLKPTETHQLNNKNLRWWRTKECLQRTEGRVNEGDHWMTKLRKVLSLHLVRLEFIMAVFKTPL